MSEYPIAHVYELHMPLDPTGTYAPAGQATHVDAELVLSDPAVQLYNEHGPRMPAYMTDVPALH